jgi:hypothetical protein
MRSVTPASGRGRSSRLLTARGAQVRPGAYWSHWSWRPGATGLAGGVLLAAVPDGSLLRAGPMSSETRRAECRLTGRGDDDPHPVDPRCLPRRVRAYSGLLRRQLLRLIVSDLGRLQDLVEAEIAELTSGRRHPSPRHRFFSPRQCGPARLAGMLLAITMAAGRHRSLGATVKWSCRLLDYHERRVFGWCR